MAFNTIVGGLVAYKFNPLQNNAMETYPLFRKAWMKVPIRLAAFGCAYTMASLCATKIFPRLAKDYHPKGGVNQNTYLNNQDLISKFRFFENGGAQADAKDQMQNYLDVYTSGPLTKAEMLNRIADGREVDADFANKFQVKRMGKDKDDLFWSFGKIHGLENLAFVDEEKLMATNGNPFLIQKLVDEVNDSEKPLPGQSFEKQLESLAGSMAEYRKTLDNHKYEYATSDKKKLLSLPFFMVKRAEQVEPKEGQKEWGLFKELYGNSWDKFAGLNFDPEEKITEFNYEQHIPKHLLAEMDTLSTDFKNMVKMMNLSSKTAFEQHKDNQAQFKSLMPILSQLNEEESEIFMHMLKNKQ